MFRTLTASKFVLYVVMPLYSYMDILHCLSVCLSVSLSLSLSLSLCLSLCKTRAIR